MSDARAEHSRRLDAARTRVAALDQLEDRIAGARLATFTGAAILAVAAWSLDAVGAAWMLAPLVAFVALVARHARLRRDRDRARRLAAFHERGLANLDGTWPDAVGDQGERYADPKHAYVDHLDVFGRGSLFHRVSSARTSQGADTLARWFTVAADPEVVRARQQAVAELRPRLDLREDLALLGGRGRRRRLHALPAWGEAPRRLDAAWVRPVAIALPLLALAGLALPALGYGWWLFLLAVLLDAAVLRALRPDIERVVAQGDAGSRDLALLGALMARIDAETFAAPLLVELRGRLGQGDARAPPP